MSNIGAIYRYHHLIYIYIYIYIYPPPRLWRRRRSWTFLPEGHLRSFRSFLPFTLLIKGPEILLPPSARPEVSPAPDTSWTSKMPPRRLQDASCLPSFFGCFFASIFNRFLMPTWLQLASENL